MRGLTEAQLFDEFWQCIFCYLCIELYLIGWAELTYPHGTGIELTEGYGVDQTNGPIPHYP